MGEYIPLAPVNDEAKKHNQNLPGMGGIYNTVNMHLYHYAGNNPVRYIDPDGRVFNVVAAVAGAVIGGSVGAVTTYLAGGTKKDIAAAALGGAAGGALAGFTCGASVAVTAAVGGASILGGATVAAGLDIAVNAIQGNDLLDGVDKAALGGAVGGLVGFGAGKALSAIRNELNTPKVHIDSSKYPETAQHIRDAQANGYPSKLTIDRTGIRANRVESLNGYNKVPGKQLDEYPPAMFKEGGRGADIRAISPRDNMGAGASMGNQLRNYPDGTIIKMVVD